MAEYNSVPSVEVPPSSGATYMSSIHIEQSSSQDVDYGVNSPLVPLAVAPQRTPQDAMKDVEPWVDFRWGSAFKMMAVLTVTASVIFGSMAHVIVRDLSLSVMGVELFLHDPTNIESHLGHPARNIILGTIIVAAVLTLLAGVIVYVVFYSGRDFLLTSYLFFASVWGVIAIVIGVNVSVHLCVVPLFVGGAIVVFACVKKGAMEFAAVNLKVAGMAVRAMPGSITCALLMGVIQFLWSIIAVTAAIGSYVVFEKVITSDGETNVAAGCFSLHIHSSASSNEEGSDVDMCVCDGEKISDEPCTYTGLGFPLMVVWLICLGWGCNLIHKIAACTVTGSVASWWFTPHEDAAPVKGAFYRATRSSFGSLCKAAFILEAWALLSMILSRVLRYVPCGRLALRCVGSALKYVLAYTIAFVGIYGLSFNEAGQRVREMFQKDGLSVLAKDAMAQGALGLLKLTAVMVYLLTSLWTFGVLFSKDKANMFSLDIADGQFSLTFEFWSIVAPQIFGCVVCLFMTSTVVEVIRAAYKAVFVCFVQDPEALALTQGQELYRELERAWADRRATLNLNARVTGHSTRSRQVL